MLQYLLFEGLVVDPLIESMISFSIRFRSVIFFHARKFETPTSLLLSLQKDILTDSDKAIHLLDRMLLSPCCFLDVDDKIEDRILLLDEGSFLQEISLIPKRVR